MTRPRPFRDVGAILIILIATFVTFAPLASAEFTSWDDYETVDRNPLLNPPTLRSLQAFWTRPHGDLYIPATYTIWYGVASFPGATEPATATSLPRLRAGPFHLINIALHAAAAVLLFAVVDLLVSHRKAAVLGALVFALHPLQVESVAWASGMKDVLFGVMSLLAIYEYLQFTQQPPASRLGRIHYAIATVAFILAMLAKPTAMVVPLIVIVLDHIMLRRPIEQVVRAIWPWLVLAIPCAIAAKLIQPAPHASDAAAPLWARPLIAADAIAFYLYKLVWPLELGFDYGRTPAYVRASGAIAWTWIVPLAVAIFSWWSWRRGGKAVAAGSLVMLIVLLPVLGLVPFDFQTYSTVADHYMYLAMLGPAVVVAWLVSRRPTTPAMIAVACVVALLGVRSFAQTAHWHDSRALFAHGLDVNPGSFAAYSHLAAIANEANRPDDAIPLIERAIKIRPDAARYSIYAESLRRKGQSSAAIAAYREALKRDDAYAPALTNLAAMLAEQGKLDQAIPLARRAVEVEPYSTLNRFNLALMYFNSNQPALAREQLEAVLRLEPNHPGARELMK